MNKLDILNRTKFVENLVQLIENISDNKSSTCFAINGVWGCGKSFVLDMFEDRLGGIRSEESGACKYFIIRYNSWKYDYYEEPLIAIVSATISAIEEKTKLFPDSEEKSEIIGMLKAAGISLISFGSTVIKEKTGLDFQKAYETILNGEKKGAEAYEKEHAYDIYLGFNKVIEKVSGLLQNIAEDYTVIIVVDELDRCMPEYAIKVLERLHHLTVEGVNIITVISIDKEQLLTSVRQIFGFNNPEKYLEKFIHFEIKLDQGLVSERICEKYADYIQLFKKDLFLFEDSVEECMQAIFSNIDIRTQEQIIKKAMLAHKLLYKDEKDYSFMCMELLIVVMICIYDDTSCFSGASIRLSSFNKVFMPNNSTRKPAFSEFFKEKFESLNFTIQQNFPDDPRIYILPERASLYGAIIFTWYWMHKRNADFIIHYKPDSVYKAISKNHEELKKYAEVIRTIS